MRSTVGQSSSLTLRSTDISTNADADGSIGNGGGLFLWGGGRLNMIDTRIRKNKAGGSGGGMYFNSGHVIMTFCRGNAITHNEAGSRHTGSCGGGIAFNSALSSGGTVRGLVLGD